MAKLNENFWEKMAKARAAKKAQANVNVSDQLPASEVQKTTTAEQDPMKAILARLEAQENEIKQLKSEKWQSEKQAKEIYKWPRKYCFSLWGDKPVISWVSYRKDNTKDREYKNLSTGLLETNHYMKLELSDWTIVEDVTNYNFLRDRKKTEPLSAKVTNNEDWTTSYEFNTTDYWKVTILSSKFIN